MCINSVCPLTTHRTGTAAQIRSQVSAAFSAGGVPNGLAAAGVSVGATGSNFLGQSPGSSVSSPFAGGVGSVSETGRTLVSGRGLVPIYIELMAYDKGAVVILLSVMLLMASICSEPLSEHHQHRSHGTV